MSEESNTNSRSSSSQCKDEHTQDNNTEMGMKEKKDSELYRWLKVPTVYKNIRKILRCKLIELFNEVYMKSI